MPDHVMAVFGTGDEATSAIERLENAGFAPSEISVLTSEMHGRATLGVQKGSKAAAGAAIGGGIGGGVAAIIGGLTAVGAIATGGAGLLAVGPVVAALAAAGAGAAAGGIIGGLIGLGIPEHQAKIYEDEINKGGTLVAVQAKGDRARIAQGILNTANAESVTTG